jgi:phosphatidylglycerophosphatase A
MVAKLIATVGGIGHLPKAPGTAGSLVGLLIGLSAAPEARWPQLVSNLILLHPWLVSLGFLVVCFLVGVVASGSVESISGQHDPPYVVVDECVGMLAVVLAAPFVAGMWWAMPAFVLFRVFDIVKPPPLKWLARRPAGWGIMLDDLGAAGYTIGALLAIRRVAEWLSG